MGQANIPSRKLIDRMDADMKWITGTFGQVDIYTSTRRAEAIRMLPLHLSVCQVVENVCGENTHRAILLAVVVSGEKKEHRVSRTAQ